MDNSATCRKFHGCAEQALSTLQSDINKLHQDGKQFTETLEEKLGNSYEDVKTWSYAAQEKVSSVIKAQIQMQHLLEEELVKIEEKENSNAKDEISSTVKSRVTRKPRKILTARK